MRETYWGPGDRMCKATFEGRKIQGPEHGVCSLGMGGAGERQHSNGLKKFGFLAQSNGKAMKGF